MTLDISLAKPATAAGEPPASLMEEAAFTAFHGRTAAPLVAYLARAGGSRALAEDLAQETYIRFLRTARVHEGEVACRRFLFTIATNLLRDHWRRAAPAALDDVPEAALVAGVSTSAAWAAHRDAEAALAPAWAVLRPRERQLLWLAYVEGYTHRELAAATGLRQASMRMLLFRARRKLAQQLREGGRP